LQAKERQAQSSYLNAPTNVKSSVSETLFERLLITRANVCSNKGNSDTAIMCHQWIWFISSETNGAFTTIYCPEIAVTVEMTLLLYGIYTISKTMMYAIDG